MLNKKGAALLQVILVAAVLAGIATLLLRASLSRTTNARLTRREVTAQMLIQSCQAEVNVLWSMKQPEIFARDLSNGDGCWMTCNAPANGDCTDANANHEYICAQTLPNDENVWYQVTATMEWNEEFGQCQITYNLHDNFGLHGNAPRVTL